jgi:hypothetical protein
MKFKVYFANKEHSNYLLNYLDCDEVFSEQNDYIICSIPWGMDDRKIIQSMINQCREIKNKIVIFSVTDYEYQLDLPENVYLFRTSVLKDLKHPREFVLPFFWIDKNLNFSPLARTEKPIVGFCGLNSKYRQNLISILCSIKDRITCNFVTRSHFWGGKPHDPEVIKEFQDNIKNSHFTICNRGAGNFSTRFYETLSAGRIPLMLDTNLILPYENMIDWDQIIIKGKTENEIVDKLLDWWETKDIILAQRTCRKIYEEYFGQKSSINKLIENTLSYNHD